MKRSDWASVGEIVSSIAVVITLLILVAGIRENTTVTSSAMTATALQEFSDVQAAIMADAELTRIYNAYLFGNVASLDEVDRSRLIGLDPLSWHSNFYDGNIRSYH